MATVRATTRRPAVRVKDHVAVRRLLARNRRSKIVSEVLNSRFLRWRYGAAIAEEIRTVPPELRTSDPSFVAEYKSGSFGLAGIAVDLGEKSPFAVAEADAKWLVARDSFEWLRHFSASDDADAKILAQQLVIDWIKYNKNSSVTRTPNVAGRRLISWLSHANFLLDDADVKNYDAITRSLGSQIIGLNATWRQATCPLRRLQALTGLLMAVVCVKGHEKKIQPILESFLSEVAQQIDADGGHVSRCPLTTYKLLLDFLPLEKSLSAADIDVPRSLSNARQNMFAYLQFLRLGDGGLCRFNGVDLPLPADLAGLFVYDEGEHPQLFGGHLKASGYGRLVGGETVIVSDIGRVPEDVAHALRAQSGCLAFEMSVAKQLIFVNSGMPSGAHDDWLAVSRATASHNTLCVAETSSAVMLKDSRLEATLDGVPLTTPEKVSAAYSNKGGVQSIRAEHDGYLEQFGVVHHRELRLNGTGRRLEGVDRLTGVTGDLRLKTDLPFAIHFHIHPDLTDVRNTEYGVVAIGLSDGSTIQFSCDSCDVTVEESLYFADSSAPRQALQVVIRGVTFGETDVRWMITHQQ